MLVTSQGKQVHLDTRKMSPKSREVSLRNLTERLVAPPYRDAPKGFFSIQTRAKLH
jgi:hypothetical protein